MSLMETRRAQIFPVLDAGQIETARRFASAEARTFAAGERIYDAGERAVPTWLLLEGEIALSRHDGLGHEADILVLKAGQFTGEVSQLAGRGTLATAHAGPNGVTALPFDAAHLRAPSIMSSLVGRAANRPKIRVSK